MGILSSLFNKSKGTHLFRKFDNQLSAVLLFPPLDVDIALVRNLVLELSAFNVFVVTDFTDVQNLLKPILNRLVKKELPILVYGDGGTIALECVSVLESKRVSTKLILLDALVAPDVLYSTDRMSEIAREQMEETYFENTDINSDILKVGKRLARQPLSNPEPATRIASDIYLLKAMGGIVMPDDDLGKYTSAEYYNFPVNGHHFELLVDFLVKDVAFFISNILKGRGNLLIFTLTTQAATPNWYKDTEGRPMGEGKALASCKRDVAFEMKQCPYPGGRYKHVNKMNVSALKQMRQHWEEALNLIRHLRDYYIEQHNITRWTLGDIWKITMYASYLPTYMLLRQEKRFLNHCVPPSVAAVYKMFIGLKAPVEQMVQDVLLGERTFEDLTAEVIHDYAEGIDAFVGPNEVCGGPKNLVEEFLNAFLDIETKTQPLSLVSWDKIVGDQEGFKKFMDQLLDFSIAKKIFLQQVQWLAKSYLPLIDNNALEDEIRKDFYLNEQVLPAGRHPEIIRHLIGFLENQSKFSNSVFIPEVDKSYSVEALKNISKRIDLDFFNWSDFFEETICTSVDYLKNGKRTKVTQDVFIQYMGMAPFERYFEGN